MELRQSIAAFFPSVLSAIRERNLVLLCQNRQLDALLNFLESRKTNSLRWGVSETFTRLEEAKRSFDQAMFALSMSKEEKRNQVFYSDVILDYITMILNKHSCRENFLHPAIQKLQAYDQKNRTPYLQTLRAYVSCLFHPSDTVKALYIHRNTLPHRLKMIEEIGEIDLTGPKVCAVLLLNFYTLGLSEE